MRRKAASERILEGPVTPMDEYARFADLYDGCGRPLSAPDPQRGDQTPCPAPGERLLDLCCGTGMLAAMAARTDRHTCRGRGQLPQAMIA